MSTHGCLLDKTPGQTTTSGQQPQTSGPQAQVLSTGSDNFGVAKVFDDGLLHHGIWEMLIQILDTMTGNPETSGNRPKMTSLGKGAFNISNNNHYPTYLSGNVYGSRTGTTGATTCLSVSVVTGLARCTNPTTCTCAAVSTHATCSTICSCHSYSV